MIDSRRPRELVGMRCAIIRPRPARWTPAIPDWGKIKKEKRTQGTLYNWIPEKTVPTCRRVPEYLRMDADG